jgi:hypothetical protein
VRSRKGVTTDEEESFCRLLGLGCPKQAFAKIATPRSTYINEDAFYE